MNIEKQLTKKMDMFQENFHYTKGALHCHTQNSLDDGFAKETDVCRTVKELGAEVAVISDHGTAMGWDDFDEAAKAAGVRPVFGVEAYYLDDVTQMKSHLVLYAMNENGLHKICKAMSRGTVIANPRDDENGFTCLSDASLELLKGGDVIATSACINGVFGSIILYNDRLNTRIDKLNNEIAEFARGAETHEAALKAYNAAEEKLAILRQEVAEAKLAAKKSFVAKQKQIESMNKKIAKAEAAFDKFLETGSSVSERSVRVALSQLEIDVNSADDFQFGLEKAQAMLNQRSAQLRAEMKKNQEIADTLAERTEKMEKASEEKAAVKTILDSTSKVMAKIEARQAKIEEYLAQKLSKEQSVALFEKRLAKMEEVFGNNFYIEIQNHGLKMESVIYLWLVGVARKHKIPLVAANDAHIAKKIQNDLTGRQIRRSLRFKKWESISEDFVEYYIKNDRELALALYQIFPEDVVIEAMTNVRKIIESCNAEIKKESHPPKAKNIANVKEEIIKIARANITKKYGNRWGQQHEERFNYEIGIIDSMGFSDYFMITYDILNVARQIGGLSYEKLDYLKSIMNGMSLDELLVFIKEHNTEPNISVGLGRGSGAGSLVCYLLNITNIDPFKYDLLFERKTDCVH